MSVGLTVHCPKCDDALAVDVDITILPGVKRKDDSLILDVEPRITDESLERVKAHAATHN